MNEPSCRKAYQSDVSDDEWAFVAPNLTLMPEPDPDTEEPPQRNHPLREVFIFILQRSAANDLPQTICRPGTPVTSRACAGPRPSASLRWFTTGANFCVQVQNVTLRRWTRAAQARRVFCCCHAAGWWSAFSRRRRVFGVWPETLSGFLRHWQACIGRLALAGLQYVVFALPMLGKAVKLWQNL